VNVNFSGTNGPRQQSERRFLGARHLGQTYLVGVEKPDADNGRGLENGADRAAGITLLYPDH
jgi:hypothetical protein